MFLGGKERSGMQWINGENQLSPVASSISDLD